MVTLHLFVAAEWTATLHAALVMTYLTEILFLVWIANQVCEVEWLRLPSDPILAHLHEKMHYVQSFPYETLMDGSSWCHYGLLVISSLLETE